MLKSFKSASMVQLHFLLILCGFSFFKSGQVRADGWQCETPNGHFGICIDVKRCQPILQVLQSAGLTQQNILYLRRSACGYNGRDPLVCCPQSRNINDYNNRNDNNNNDNTNSNNNNNNNQFPRATTPTPSVSTTSAPKPIPTQITSTTSSVSSPLKYSYQLPTAPNCGFSNISSTRIVGGVPALFGQFPWMAVLGYKNINNPNQPKWLCGGSMITEKHILTAAHCVFNRPDLYVARVGDIDLYSDDDGAYPTTVALANAKIHEQYNARKHINDIAILTMMQPHNNPSVWPICLPVDASMKSLNFARTYPFIAGWGVVERNGPNSPTLQTALIPVVTNEECQQAYNNFSSAVIDKNVLCAGYALGGKDTCQGDSGGPLMYSKKIPGSKNFEFFQIGVVSYGHECALAGFPGVYTRVTEYVDWIQNNLN